MWFLFVLNVVLFYYLLPIDLQIVLMAKQERKVDDVHQITLAPNETKSNKHTYIHYTFMTIIKYINT